MNFREYTVTLRQVGKDRFAVVSFSRVSSPAGIHASFPVLRTGAILATAPDPQEDRRPVWSFEVDRQHVRWCGTLDQWEADRLAYVDQSAGEWVLLNSRAYQFREPRNPDGSPGQVTTFRAVRHGGWDHEEACLQEAAEKLAP